MKLFHVIPEAGRFKTGINVTPVNCKLAKMVCLYLAIEDFGFVGVYFGRRKKTGKIWMSYSYKYLCRKTSRYIGRYAT